MHAADDIRSWLTDHQRALEDLLRRLVEAESPSDDVAAQAAPQALLREALAAAGLAVRHVPGRGRSGGHLYARPADRRRGRPFQLCLGHSDTVWPHGTLAAMPFAVRDETLHGPGVLDMKGGLVILVGALQALHALGLRPEADPVVFVNSDEEVGSDESTDWIVRLARGACRAFVLEPGLGRAGHLKTRRKGVGRFTVRVRGRGAHAGLDPQAGASAILELSFLIQQLHALNDLERGVTVNVGLIEGGQQTNVVAPTSAAHVDVRVPTRADARRIEAAIYGLEATTPGTTLEITGAVSRAPMEATPRNRALWHAARDVGAALGMTLDEGFAGGGSDGNTTSRFTATLDGLGAVGLGAHAEDEHMTRASLLDRAALLAGLLLLPADAAVAHAAASLPEPEVDAAR